MGGVEVEDPVLLELVPEGDEVEGGVLGVLVPVAGLVGVSVWTGDSADSSGGAVSIQAGSRAAQRSAGRSGMRPPFKREALVSSILRIAWVDHLDPDLPARLRNSGAQEKERVLPEGAAASFLCDDWVTRGPALQKTHVSGLFPCLKPIGRDPFWRSG